MQSNLKPAEYVAALKKVLSENGDPTVAEGQMRYMRFKFAYYGLKAPAWVAISKELFGRHGLLAGSELQDFVRRCFADEYREVNYLGLQMTEKVIKKQPESFIDFLEEIIQLKSWWDTVDWINKLVGIHLRRFPQLQHPISNRWISGNNIWLQRVAILHQLTYKDEVDWQLLRKMILHVRNSDEFFLQKAAGWALRQYSKFEAERVVSFIKKEQLPALTKREGLKWLKKQGRV